MKIFYLTKYAQLGASSRLRSIQYFPYLEEENYIIYNSPLFNETYLKALYNKKKSKFFFIILCYIRRFFNLFKVFSYDLLIIEKELFPYFPSYFEYFLKVMNVKYIVDYDDAIFHNYDLSKNSFIKKFLSKKIDKVMKYSTCVFAGNKYLAKRAEIAGAKKIVLLPTVINHKKYYKIEKNQSNNLFIIGWIGSPSTYRYLEKLIPSFKKLKNTYPNIQINIIGAKQQAEVDDFIHYIPWKESTEVLEINKFDLGVMPLNNTPWELGKCSYKLIQYMGCSVPIMGSPIGMNNEVIIENYNGFIVNDNEWYEKISYAINNKDLIKEMGNNGRLLIQEKYNLLMNVDKIIKTIEELK